MARLKIAETRDSFERDGKRFFYLADTVWPALGKVSLEEWEEYLDFRKIQGFNVLHIWLQNKSLFGSHPAVFPFNNQGKPDYYRMNDAYFHRAKKVLTLAKERGFIPAIALLWADKVKDTWLSKQFGPDHLIPLDAVGPYTEYVVKAFDEFEPIYMVGGDISFESEETSKAPLIALDVVKSLSPASLTTLHLCGDSSSIPEELVQSEKLDFYLYQSGHNFGRQDRAYQYAEELYRLPVKRPIVNGEPCYEGLNSLEDWGTIGPTRFNAFDVRKAIWGSLLSGAKAGAGYGAFGIWPWHTANEQWQETWLEGEGPWEGEQFFGKPYHWRTALTFPGAWDASYAKWIFETYDLFDLQPQRDLLHHSDRDIRLAATEDCSKVVIYIPYSADVSIRLNGKEYDWVQINLSDRTVGIPELHGDGDSSTVKMHPFNSDVLVIGRK